MDNRIFDLNDLPVNSNGDFVVYWMQQSQRAEYNFALEYAIQLANENNKPVFVFFGITDDYPDANFRHYTFLIEGLIETIENLNKKGILTILKKTNPAEEIIKYGKSACAVVTDRGYLRLQRIWRKKAAERINCLLCEVDSDLIIPVSALSAKEEYNAKTLRMKVNKKIDDYLCNFKNTEIIKKNYYPTEYSENNLAGKSFEEIASLLNVDRSVGKSKFFNGGRKNALNYLKIFLEEKIYQYSRYRNHPNLNYQSNLSPYLHFGQISTLEISFAVEELHNKEITADFLEELIIRRELAYNFVWYNKGYDEYDKMTYSWALKTLAEHSIDKRDYVYSLEILENAATHDKYWNAAQNEMVITGKMHGYMRMYWGKKIIEWTKHPQEAFDIMVFMNNKYQLDGRDPNGYAGIAWCFGKHDRAWKEREIFGKIRYMNAKGLERKFDMEEYVRMVEFYNIADAFV